MRDEREDRRRHKQDSLQQEYCTLVQRLIQHSFRVGVKYFYVLSSPCRATFMPVNSANSTIYCPGTRVPALPGYQGTRNKTEFVWLKKQVPGYGHGKHPPKKVRIPVFPGYPTGYSSTAHPQAQLSSRCAECNFCFGINYTARPSASRRSYSSSSTAHPQGHAVV